MVTDEIFTSSSATSRRLPASNCSIGPTQTHFSLPLWFAASDILTRILEVPFPFSGSSCKTSRHPTILSIWRPEIQSFVVSRKFYHRDEGSSDCTRSPPIQKHRARSEGSSLDLLMRAKTTVQGFHEHSGAVGDSVGYVGEWSVLEGCTGLLQFLPTLWRSLIFDRIQSLQTGVPG